MGFNVLVIDDSAHSRALVSEMVGSIPGVGAVSTAVDGVDGFRQARKSSPDLVVLDLEMPNMDGFTFLRLVNDIPALILSSRRGADDAGLSIKLGALDFIEKPARLSLESMLQIRDRVEGGIRLLPFIRPGKRARHKSAGVPARAVLMGASTGGPGAVSSVLAGLPAAFNGAAIIAQHMPEWLSSPFVRRLGAVLPVKVSLATDGCRVEAGAVLVAPGGSDISFEKKAGVIIARLTPAPGGRLTPSIDQALSSASRVWGPALTGVIMTGMGTDGSLGAQDVKARGGRMMAESATSAVSFAMPEAAIRTGAIDEVADRAGIARHIALTLAAGVKMA